MTGREWMVGLLSAFAAVLAWSVRRGGHNALFTYLLGLAAGFAIAYTAFHVGSLSFD